MSIRFEILGEMRVAVADSAVALGGLRQRSVLALLLLARGRGLSNDGLVEALWPDEPPPTASKTVQVYISRLRALLGPHAARLASDSAGYRLVVAEDELDAARFEGLLARARAVVEQEDHAFALPILDEAVSMWRGPALADFAYEPFAAAEAERLEELRIEAVELRFACLVETGAGEGILADLRKAVSAHEYREGLWHSLALALYRTGRQAEALEALRAVRRVLADELGIDPGPDLQALELSILNQEPGLAGRRRKPLAGRRIQAGLTRLIGRERELAELRVLLTDHRLITITGAGGTGKTRMADALALAEGPNHLDGAYFVDLSGVREAGLVALTLASSLGIAPAPNTTPETALDEALEDRRALIVLDNFEQIREAGQTIGRLIAGSRHLRIVITSRVPLRIRGEHEYLLQPLPLVEGDPTLVAVAACPAVQLFIDRAASSGAHVEVTGANAALLAEMCRRLDGLPLAIELAAARARALPLEEILARLDHRMTFLTGGPRDLPDRQRTLRAALEWSHDLLADPEARLLRRLAVFAGGFTTAAAEAVSGDLGGDFVDSLASLVDHHLVRLDERADPSRYVLLETIREYAGERLEASGEADETHRRHVEFFAALAEESHEAMRGQGQSGALATLTVERDNIRAALAWTLDRGMGPTGLRLAGSLRVWWEAHGHSSEGRRWLDALLDLPAGAADDLRARALSQCGALAFRQGDLITSRMRHNEALEIRRRLGDAVGIAKTLNNLALVSDELGDYEGSRDLMRESVAAWRAGGDPWGLAIVLGNSGAMLASQLAFEDARNALVESIALARTNGDGVALAMGLSELGIMCVFQGRLDEAGHRLEEALGLVTDLDAPHDRAYALEGLAHLAMARGELRLARERLLEAVELVIEAGEQVELARCLERVGRVLDLAGEAESAVSVWACAARVRGETGARMYPLDRSWYEPAVEGTRLALGPENFDRAWRDGSVSDPRTVADQQAWWAAPEEIVRT